MAPSIKHQINLLDLMIYIKLHPKLVMPCLCFDLITIHRYLPIPTGDKSFPSVSHTVGFKCPELLFEIVFKLQQYVFNLSIRSIVYGFLQLFFLADSLVRFLI